MCLSLYMLYTISHWSTYIFFYESTLELLFREKIICNQALFAYSTVCDIMYSAL